MGCRESTILPRVTCSCCNPTPDKRIVSTSSAARCCDPDSSKIWITARQKQLINASWTTLAPSYSEYEQLGADVFLRIFSRHPELQQLFPFGEVESQQRHTMKDNRMSPLRLIQSHPAFRSHAAAFANAIGMAVETMDDWDGALSDMLLMLGSAHATTRGFTVQNFEAFAESLIHVWKRLLSARVDAQQLTVSDGNGDLAENKIIKDATLNEVMHAWEILFIFILMKLRDGYQLTTMA